jgi:hypothetical protein
MSSLVTPQHQHDDDDDDNLALQQDEHDDDDDDNLALQQDELEALASIFSDDECVVSDAPPYEVRLHVKVPLSNPIIVVVHLPSDYPSTSPPVIGELSCATLSTAATAAFLDHAVFPFEAGGAGCLYDWYDYLREHPPTCKMVTTTTTEAKQQKQPAAAAADDSTADLPEVPRSRCAILINHMNDSSGYERKLRKWSKQLQLGVEMWWHEKRKRNQKGNKQGCTQQNIKKQQQHRHEHVYCLLSGDREALHQFQQRLRTEYVDVNGSGVKCKERQSRTLALDASSSFIATSISTSMPTSSSEPPQFRSFQYDDNDNGRLPLSNALDAFGCLEQHYARYR